MPLAPSPPNPPLWMTPQAMLLAVSTFFAFHGMPPPYGTHLRHRSTSGISSRTVARGHDRTTSDSKTSLSLSLSFTCGHQILMDPLLHNTLPCVTPVCQSATPWCLRSRGWAILCCIQSPCACRPSAVLVLWQHAGTPTGVEASSLCGTPATRLPFRQS